MYQFMNWQEKILRDKDKGGEGGGGAGGGNGGNPPDYAKEFEAMKTANAALLAKVEALEKASKAGKPNPEDDQGLADKAQKEKEAADKAAADSKKLEAALKFDLGSKEWLKTNQSLLPKNAEGIFTAAEKEKYNSAIEKANAIKTGLIQSFFEIQSNVELLTPGLKTALEDWQKLTNTKKQETAEQIYQTVFEPAFEMLIRVKKAEKLGQSGTANPSDAEAAYKKKLMEGSKKHYLGDKYNA